MDSGGRNAGLVDADVGDDDDVVGDGEGCRAVTPLH